VKNAVGDGIKSCCYKAASGLGETKCSQAERHGLRHYKLRSGRVR